MINSLKDDLNEILNSYLTEMMNAFRSSRNAWIKLEKDKENKVDLLEKTKTSRLEEILKREKPLLLNSFNLSELLEEDKNSLSYDKTIEKVENFMKKSKSQGYNKFIITDRYAVSLRGIDNNEPPKKINLVLSLREFLYWHYNDFIVKFQKRINYLAKMTLVFQFSFFETCLKDLVKKLYNNKPELMKPSNPSKKVNGDTETAEELIKILNREVDWWGYRSIDKIAKRLNARFKINLRQDFKNWEKLREAYYIRNIIVHNSGIVNEPLCKQLDYDHSRIGEIFDIQPEYIENIYKIIRESLIYIRNGLVLLEK